MPLANGTQIGGYVVSGPLGAGGMGEVYRARDSRLNRDVALKVLPGHLLLDAGYKARFEREAQLLASLNHPNIAAIYGIAENAIVMELVPGSTLADRKFPLEEALGIARQVAEALEAAHEKGIIHRDLKPGNIIVTPDGVAKVLDFGLAKAAEKSAGPTTSDSPTLTLRASEAGLILGTAGYMAPEQAAGKPVDKRADIWAFGVVLFELLTGTRLFHGETVSHTLADVLRAPIDLQQLPADTPRVIRELVGRCLERNVRLRLRDIGEARVAIEKYLANPAATEPVGKEIPPSKWPWGIAAVAAVLAVAALGYAVYQNTRQAAPGVAWLSVTPPKGAGIDGFGQFLAVSPDGRRIAFQGTINAAGKSGIWVRELNSPDAHLVPGTENGARPFWSPDGRYIGFHAQGRLYKIGVAGGVPIPICDTPGLLAGGSWSEDDIILFGVFGGGIQRVPASGGTATPVTALQPGENSHRWPQFLPGGKQFLYTARASAEKSAVYVADFTAKERRLAVRAASNAVYVPSGHLLYAVAGTLMAQPFDAAAGRTTGEALPIAKGVDGTATATSFNFSTSPSGTLAFAAGVNRVAQLTWFDRSGKVLGVAGEAGLIESLALSPDGQTVAFSRAEPQSEMNDIWLRDLTRGTESRFTFTGDNRFPVWSLDRKEVFFSRSNVPHRKSVSGEGGERVFDLPAGQILSAWSPDGRYGVLTTSTNNPVTGNDLWVLPLSGERKAVPLIQTPFTEHNAALSPDGQWLAYSSNESGQDEVYVTRFPSGQGKWRVSTAGGSDPEWRGDGRELFFHGKARTLEARQVQEGKMMAVPVKSGAEFQAGAPVPLFDFAMRNDNANFAVSRDGRFLIPVFQKQEALPITVILNWTGLLAPALSQR